MTPLVLASLLVASASPDATAPPKPVLSGAEGPPLEVVKPAPSKLKDRFMTYASFGFNAYTYLPATATQAEANLTPASRGIIFQQVGAGYYFHKYLRVQLTVIFGETVSNVPMGASTFTSLSFVPQLVFSTHGFFTGGGPSLSPISYGKTPNFDAGIYTATGYAVKLPHGLSIPISVQLVLMLNQRTSFAVTPAVALAWRF
jgi:hypothetical protein